VLIVGPAVESVKEYLELYEERSPDLPACPRCGGPLRKHGRYHRKVIMAEGIVEIPLYRGYCPRCRRTGAAMPAFLKPYARYPADLREKVLEAHIADGRTWREAGDLVFATAMAPVRKTLVRWARDAETIAVSATTLLAEYVTRLEPTLDQRRLWPSRPRERWPDLELLFRYGRHLRDLLVSLLPGKRPFLGVFTFLRLQRRDPVILL